MAHRYKVIQGGPYPHLVTCTIVRWLPVFISGDYAGIILDSLRYLRDNRDVLIHAYVIMPTHFHAILTAQRDDLAAVMRDLKKFTSRAIYQLAEETGNQLLTWFFRNSAKAGGASRFKVWKDEYHPKAIAHAEVLRQKVEYLHQNPVRKGMVLEPVSWLYSSAAAYEGGGGPLEIDLPEW